MISPEDKLLAKVEELEQALCTAAENHAAIVVEKDRLIAIAAKEIRALQRANADVWKCVKEFEQEAGEARLERDRAVRERDATRNEALLEAL